MIEVKGSTITDGFASSELLFAYANDTSQTWFLIAEDTRPISGTLALWDTTTLTDGDYTLRLLVNRLGADPIRFEVPGLRVRNYSPIETGTPAPTLTPTITSTVDPNSLPTATPTLIPSPSPIPSLTPTLTPLPTNPAELSEQGLTGGLMSGALGAGAALVLLGFYLALRKALRRSYHV